jgi:hypothetical protein
MSRKTEEQRQYLASLSERDLFVEHLRMSLDKAVDELKFIMLLMDRDPSDVGILDEFSRLRTTLATTRYMLNHQRPW